jgi:hypothetical protein
MPTSSHVSFQPLLMTACLIYIELRAGGQEATVDNMVRVQAYRRGMQFQGRNVAENHDTAAE